MSVVEQSYEVLHTHARSFTLASWFLPRGSADGAAVLYALCRLIDDLVDEATDAEAAHAALDGLVAELRAQVPARPLVKAWRARGGELEPILALIDGARQDLTHRPFDSDRALIRYSYAVAGTVGLSMCPIIGAHGETARRHAIDLGVAMQITNICRDVAEDAAMGRVYLPEARLRDRGTTSLALLEGHASHASVSGVVLELLELADTYYASGEEGLRYIPLRARFAIAVAARVYRAIGVRLRRHGGDALAGRTVVPPLGKAVAVVRGLVVALFASLRPRRGHDDTLHAELDGLPGCASPAEDRVGAHAAPMANAV